MFAETLPPRHPLYNAVSRAYIRGYSGFLGRRLGALPPTDFAVLRAALRTSLAPYARPLTDVEKLSTLGGVAASGAGTLAERRASCEITGGDYVGGVKMGEDRKRGSSRVALFASVLAIAGVASFSLDRALANPNAMNGEGLLDACTRAEADWIGFCNGYIQAAVDLLALQDGSACIPAGTTRNQVYDAVMPLLSASSAMKGENAFRALTVAITAKFKCK